MNSIRPTKRAQKALETAVSMAEKNCNPTVETEHLLKAIAKEKSALNSILKPEALQELGRRLDEAIAGFPRVANTYSNVSTSNQLAMLMSQASKRARDFVSVPLLLLLLVEDPRNSKYFPTAGPLKEGLTRILDSKQMGSEDADDPEDKLSRFAVDMVEKALNNQYDPVIGRDEEIRQVVEILAKKSKSNAILVGKPGVGKTAIVNGIAQLIARGEYNVLDGHKLYAVDVGAMVAGSSYRGQFEERLKELVKEAEKDRKTILFIDEIHMVLGAGKTDGAMDAANILKPSLADGSLKVIGATTYDEYRQYVTKDPAFERRFTRVNVKEQSVEDTVTVMRGLRERIEMHHGVKIADRALVYASQMGKRYIANRRLPDLAIDLVDTACASVTISLSAEPPALAGMRTRLWSLELEKTSIEIDLKRDERDQSVRDNLQQVEEKIEALKREIQPIEEAFNREKSHVIRARDLKQKLENARNQMEQARRVNDKYAVYDIQTNIIPIYEKELAECTDKVEVIDIQHVAEVISRLSGIPLSSLSLRENDRLLSMNARIKESIFDQDAAVDTVADAIIASRTGLSDPNKPIGSFMLLGPTGVGKTELAKSVCRELNGTADHMVILDMSDYASEISLTKLLGAPAGYVGCEQGGALTEPVKEMPYNVVLLDEFDHAHPSVLNMLYQLLDEGRVVDGRGTSVSFRNTVIFMTSNMGQEYITAENIDRRAIESALLRRFGHAFVNRVDNVVIFGHLGRPALVRILERELAVLNRKLAEKKASFEISPRIVERAMDMARSTGYGARIVKRFVRDNFNTAIAKILLARPPGEATRIYCHPDGDGMEQGHLYGEYRYVIN